MKNFNIFFKSKLTLGNLFTIAITLLFAILFRQLCLQLFGLLSVRGGLELLDIIYLLVVVSFRFIVNVCPEYLQSLLNRAYTSLEWCLNSPPKPHAFASLPLQSRIHFWLYLKKLFISLIVPFMILLLVFFSLRFPCKFIFSELGISWFYIVICGISSVVSYVTILLYREQEYFKITVLLCIFIFSTCMALALPYIYSELGYILPLFLYNVIDFHISSGLTCKMDIGSLLNPEPSQNNPVPQQPSIPEHLVSFRAFGEYLESKCITVAQTKAPGYSGEKSVTLGEIGVRKNSPEWIKLTQAFPKPDHDLAGFDNRLYNSSMRSAVIWSTKEVGFSPGSSLIEKIKNT